MVKKHIPIPPAVILLGVLFFSALAGNDVRTVQSDFDRCVTRMDRVEREVRRYEEIVTELRLQTGDGSDRNQDKIRSELFQLVSRAEYFRNRIDRSSGQAAKIREDVSGVKGTTCSSCLVSNVNMYCRTTEALISEVEEYLGRARNFQSAIRTSRAQGRPGRAGKVESRLFALRTRIEENRDSAQTCADASGAVLWRQTLVHVERADSLQSAGLIQEAGKALDIAETILSKALSRCGRRDQ